jgi:hypothetical protein
LVSFGGFSDFGGFVRFEDEFVLGVFVELVVDFSVGNIGVVFFEGEEIGFLNTDPEVEECDDDGEEDYEEEIQAPEEHGLVVLVDDL